MSEPFLGQITLFPFQFAPVGWALCQGQILPISQNTALFALLGTYYGGDGRTTFGLPDLRGRVPNGQGQGPGLQAYGIGQKGGAETVIILPGNAPAHTHTLPGFASPATSGAPAANALPAEGQVPGRGGGVTINMYAASGAATTLSSAQLGTAQGGNQPHNNLQPFLALSWCIALQGIFPPRP